MERDRRFEVQYLLSVMIVVSGIAASRNFSRYLTGVVAGGFLLLIAIHLTLLSVRYSFSQITDVVDVDVERLSAITPWTLVLITLGFVYVSTHVVVHAILLTGAATRVFRRVCENPSVVRSIIIHLFPMLPMGLLGVPAIQKIRSSLRVSRDLSLHVVPDTVQVYPEADQTEEILVDVEKDTDREYELTLDIDLPKQVMAEVGDDLYVEKFSKDISLNGTTRDKTEVSLCHDSREKRAVTLEVEIEHSDKKMVREVDCVLVP